MKYNKSGLNEKEVKKLQEEYGKNTLGTIKKENFFIKTLHIICEPMFLLLIIASIIYFVLGRSDDGIIMLIFVIVMISIDVIQEWKTDKTLNALKELSNLKITVIRDNKQIIISSEDLVPGDLMLIYEGIKLPADGYVVKCSGLRIDESSLTGESIQVWKHTIESKQESTTYFRDDYCYAGTLVVGGNATILVDKIGIQTEYGKIGNSIIKTKKEITPLEKQINKLVSTCSIIALILFVFVCIFTFLNLSNYELKQRLIESILSGITLAMAMIPEEFPVVLTVFLSMGAWRLAKKNSLVKKLPSVETLGAISVLCVDKTGTITKNEMEVKDIWVKDGTDNDLLKIMGMACMEDTYDPMEKSMLKKCYENSITRKYLFNNNIVKEYPFTDQNKMMGKLLEKDNELLLVCKGSLESIINICKLSPKEKEKIEKVNKEFALKGLRVIAIASNKIKNKNEIKNSLLDYELEFNGIVGLIDPPRKTIYEDIKRCNDAKIRVIMITGDNGLTASSIAKDIGILNSDKVITGAMLDKMSDYELKEKVREVNIFSRVTPEHKMRIVKSLKENGEIVAMTGDGVNDAVALKKADIGIAMGKRGSEVSREAADLILMDDNFSTIIDTIEDGRRIYDNIRSSVGYIFTIHIPIALSSLLAPLLGISLDALMILPIHVVILELLIDPTCSIVLERQPAERNIMNRPPRKKDENILTINILIKSIIQGIIIFLASFITYYIILKNTNEIKLARTCGLVIIMLSNLFLVLVNSSNIDLVFMKIKYFIKDKVMWIVTIGTILFIGLISYSPLNNLFNLAPLSLSLLLLCIMFSFVSVFWYELVKLIKNIKY